MHVIANNVSTIDLDFFDHQVSPNKNRNLPHLGRAFTDVQEMRQAAWPDAMMSKLNKFFNLSSFWWILVGLWCQNIVAGGSNFIRKSLQAFRPSTCKSMILVDMFGYDGCPALASLEASIIIIIIINILMIFSWCYRARFGAHCPSTIPIIIIVIIIIIIIIITK